MADSDNYIDRDELLRGGMASGKRASALLFAIENLTASLVSQAQQATAFFMTQKAIEERESEYLEAYAEGRQLPKPPTIQDLERYAPYWSNLVTEADATLKASLAFALGTKYKFTEKQVPHIRMALGLDLERVGIAFEQQYNKPLSSIYRLTISWREHLRWGRSSLAYRLESLPPFWVAFIITIPLGSGILAMPIALAEAGPVAGIGLVILFGLISALTVISLAEAVARSCTTSLGLGYFGQLVSEYLGAKSSVFLTFTLAIDSFLVLVIFYLGISNTLEVITSIPGEAWAILIFGAVFFFLSRKSLNSTVASSMVIGVINLLILIILPLFALPYLNPSFFSLRNIPMIKNGAFDFSMVQMVFGVLLSNYSSHLLVGNYGRVILRRDPSGRSWIYGCLAAIGISILVSSLWVISINGAVPAEVLALQTGTAIPDLANLVGPIADWLGSSLIVLSLGLGCVHLSMGLFFLIDERLPQKPGRNKAHKGHYLQCAIPALIAFLISEWLITNEGGSFTGLLGFVGIMTLPIISGIYPVLLLAATRRKGDIVPGFILKGIGNPVVLAGTYTLFIGSIFLHGLFAYQETLERGIIILVGCVILVMTVIMLRQRALASRAVIELRQDLTGRKPIIFNLTAGGQPVAAEVLSEYGERVVRINASYGEIASFYSLKLIHFHLPTIAVDEVKIWAHKITPQGKSEALPVQGRLQFADTTHNFDFAQGSGLEIFRVKKEPKTFDILFSFEKML